MKIYNKDGIEMFEVASIARKDDLLVVKGKMMGTMATSLHVPPRALWEAFAMLSWRSRLALPLLLLKGWRGT
jgi:hypothetical protein